MNIKFFRSNFLFAFFFIIAPTVSAQLPSPSFFTPAFSAKPSPSLLINETFQRGIFFQHLQQSHGLHGLDDTLGSGACVLDADNDGDMDLYFVAGSGATRFFGKQHWWSKQPEGQLYINDGSGYFSLIKNNTGLPSNHWGMGCNSADIDNDGFTDLIITGFGKNWISYGKGNGSFRTEQLGKLEHWSTAVSLYDINNDGLLDIYIGNYLKYQKNSKTLETNTGFSENQAAFSPEKFPAQSNELYINSGNRKFKNQAKEYNLLNADGRTLGLKWLNQNNDAWSDLLIINDSGSETQLYINQQGEKFERAPLNLQIDSLHGLRDSASLTLGSDTSQPISAFSSRLGNPLYLLSQNNDDYKNLTWNTLLGADKLERTGHWGIASADFNGDGLDDLYVGSGLSIPDSDAHRLSQGQPDSLLLQTSQGNLHKQYNEAAIHLSTRSVIPVDVDNDGDTDLVLTHNNGPAQLKINNSNPKYWIGLDIKTAQNLRNRYNKVKIVQGKEIKWLFPFDDSFLSNSDYRRTTSLANNNSLAVTIFWKSGKTSEYNNLDPNQFYLLKPDKDNTIFLNKNNIKTELLPLDLAIWQIKLDEVNWKRMLKTFNKASTYNKQILLEEAHRNDNHSLILAFIELAQNKGINLENISEVLNEQELEMSLPLVIHQINKNINCETLDIIKSWFIEEEAMLLSKNLFIAPLVKELYNAKPSEQICILDALSESKNLRPTIEIERLLSYSEDIDVKKSAIHSLGELRRSQTVPVLQNLLNDPLLKNEAENALANFKSDSRLRKSSIIKDSIVVDATYKNTKINNVTCPRLKFDKILSLSNREIATLFKLCSNNSFYQWVNFNLQNIKAHYNKLINNTYLSSIQLKILLESTNQSKIIGSDKILTGLLNKLNIDSKKIIVLNAMLDLKNRDTIKSTAQKILINEKNSTNIRIAAGNILIDDNPELIIKHIGSIFHE